MQCCVYVSQPVPADVRFSIEQRSGLSFVEYCNQHDVTSRDKTWRSEEWSMSHIRKRLKVIRNEYQIKVTCLLSFYLDL